MASLQRHGRGFVRDIELVEFVSAVRLATSLAVERRSRPVSCELRLDRPVFPGLEGLDLGFALADETQRNRLHPAGGARAGQLAPEHGRKRKPDQIVERAAGEIGARPAERRWLRGCCMASRIGLACVTALKTTRSTSTPLQRLLVLQDLQNMPGNGLSLAIGVGGEDQLVRALDGLERYRLSRFADLANRRPRASRKSWSGIAPTRPSTADRARGRRRPAPDSPARDIC